MDPEGNDIKYGWDWNGDEIVDEWTEDFYSAGEEIKTFHIWEQEGTFQVSVLAEDEHGAQSEWSDPLSVIMPKSKSVLQSTFFNLLLKFFCKHQNLKQLFQRTLN